ncbi:MAG: nicotinamide mononucleotide transporter, partial [Erysipelotrichaceae bacterium]|nr:nicotinamide mononucleotide transporter [Erysipelotrichaceae bacterium]
MDDVKLNNLKKSFKELKWYEYLMGVIMIIIAAKAMAEGFMTGSSNGNPAWLTVINFISAVCGVICIFFTAKANISNFAFATVNTIVYAIYLVYWHIWGTAALEIFFYIPTNFISWYHWAKHRDEELTQKTKAKKLTLLQNIVCTLIVIGSAVVYHVVLVSYPRLKHLGFLFHSLKLNAYIISTRGFELHRTIGSMLHRNLFKRF